METLASITGHHPDICYLQYEIYRLSYITTEDANYSSIRSTNRHCKFSVVHEFFLMTKIIVNTISQNHIEPEGHMFSLDH